MTPPREPPVVAMPVAEPRDWEKKCPMEETTGVKIREVPRPARRPKERRKCQYSRGFVSEWVLNCKVHWGMVVLTDEMTLLPRTRLCQVMVGMEMIGIG